MVEASSDRTSSGQAGPVPTPCGSEPDSTDGMVEAVILAGGHAWGDNPLEQTVCRSLVPIAGRPLLLHMLEELARSGITRVSVCVNNEGQQIRRLLKDGSDLGMEINYYQDVMPRGPAGCARDVAADSDARRFIVLEGTILPQLDLRELIRGQSPAVLTVVVTPGRSVVGPRERVLEPAGIYMFTPAAFAHVPETGYQDIKETLIPRLHVSGERVDTYVADPRHVTSVNGLGAYLRVSHQAVEQLSQREVPGDYLRVDGAFVHETARVDASVRLIGPVLIGPNVILSAGCIIVGPATIGSGTEIGAGAVVCRCVLWSKCQIGDRASLDQCIVTDGSVVPAGRELRHSVVVPPRRLRAHQRIAPAEVTSELRGGWGPCGVSKSAACTVSSSVVLAAPPTGSSVRAGEWAAAVRDTSDAPTSEVKT